MNKAEKHIVVVGFTKEQRANLGLPSIEGGIIRYVPSIEYALKYHGYLLVYDNKDNINMVEFDKKYRKSLNKFVRIWYYHPAYRWKKDNYSRIERVGPAIFEDILFSMNAEWEQYKQEVEQEETKRKCNFEKQTNLNKLYAYLTKFTSITTKQIAEDLNIRGRTVERYMKDLNKTYQNIGYDYKQSKWYLIW